MNELTHSYTAQYGKVLSYIFLFTRGTGTFGPKVQKFIDECTKKILKCSCLVNEIWKTYFTFIQYLS